MYDELEVVFYGVFQMPNFSDFDPNLVTFTGVDQLFGFIIDKRKPGII